MLALLCYYKFAGQIKLHHTLEQKDEQHSGATQKRRRRCPQTVVVSMSRSSAIPLLDNPLGVRHCLVLPSFMSIVKQSRVFVVRFIVLRVRYIILHPLGMFSILNDQNKNNIKLV